MRHHSVETPLMIEYHLNMSKWGSECIYIQSTYLRTTPVCLGITYLCFVPERLPVIRRGPKYQHQYFSFLWDFDGDFQIAFWTLSKMLFESHHQNLWNFFLQIENWNGDSKAIIDKVQNVLYCEVSSVNPHNPYDAPWGVIYKTTGSHSVTSEPWSAVAEKNLCILGAMKAHSLDSCVGRGWGDIKRDSDENISKPHRPHHWVYIDIAHPLRGSCHHIYCLTHSRYLGSNNILPMKIKAYRLLGT